MSEDISYRIDSTLVYVMQDLGDEPMGRDVIRRTGRLIDIAELSPTGEALLSALSAHLYVLNHIPDGGFTLTAAGYLRPADVRHLAEVLPTMRDWLFPVTREVDAPPVLGFREHLTTVGLLRETRGSLSLTKLGQRLRKDPDGLWHHLAGRLVPRRRGFEKVTATLLLLHAATSADQDFDLSVIVQLLGDLGWSRGNGKPLLLSNVYWLWNVLRSGLECVGPGDADFGTRGLSAAAVSLVRDALLTLDTSSGEQPAIEA